MMELTEALETLTPNNDQQEEQQQPAAQPATRAHAI
jgi:hypothetical protein